MSQQYFEVVKKEIGDVYIEPRFTYEIPRFQRNYSWEEKNVAEFWETLFSPESVFLGTIIFNNRRKDESVLEIIDGQQRYLTIQILAAVIRDTCMRLQAEFQDDEFVSIARGVTKLLIGRQDTFQQDKFEYYLTPGESIRKFFREYIQEFGSEKRIDETLKTKKNSEEDRVKKAFLCFRERLQNKLSEVDSLADKKQLLKDLVDRRLSRHFFARIEIADEDLAYEIFETVNAKGVDLNVADLIKNQIFRHVLGGDQLYTDTAKVIWSEVIENVDSTGLSMKDFLSYYWSSRYQYVAERRLYREIREHFRDDKDLWREFLEDLHLNAGFLKLVFSGDVEDLTNLLGDLGEAQKCYNSLRILRNLKAKTWAILYLCLFRNLVSNDTPAKIPLKLGKRWEIISKFTFVYFQVMGHAGNWYFDLIWKFCGSIEEFVRSRRDAAAFSDLFKTVLFVAFESKLPKTKEAFEEGFLGISYKTEQRTRVLIRYVLSSIEEELGGKYDEGFDETKVSIEHILPQEPKVWGLAKKDIKSHVNQLGNLLLIGRRLNGAVGNKPLEEKLAEFENSQLHQVRDFLQKSRSGVWMFASIKEKDFSAIDQRGSALADIAFNVWVTKLRQAMGF
jgi:uncharacterized protein with ParB-like and HNH nuclease domain